MARRSRYAGLSLGALPLVGESVKGTDVLVGVLAGIIGAAGVKAIAQKVLPPETWLKLKESLGIALPLAGGVSVAAILYYAQKGMDKDRATGHAIGAAAAGLVVTTVSYLKDKEFLGLKFDAPPVQLSLSDYNGLLVDNANRSMNGLIVDNNAALGRLGAISMGGDDELGYSDVVALQS
jgi:Kef-type K+ transport system membrane component KefB